MKIGCRALLPLLATTAVTLAVLAAVVVLRWCDHREITAALRLVDDKVTLDDVTALKLAGPHAPRRSGYEFLFSMLATQNVEVLNAAGATKIFVACAHCFNTLKNEYPQLGGSYRSSTTPSC